MWFYPIWPTIPCWGHFKHCPALKLRSCLCFAPFILWRRLGSCEHSIRQPPSVATRFGLKRTHFIITHHHTVWHTYYTPSVYFECRGNYRGCNINVHLSSEHNRGRYVMKYGTANLRYSSQPYSTVYWCIYSAVFIAESLMHTDFSDWKSAGRSDWGRHKCACVRWDRAHLPVGWFLDFPALSHEGAGGLLFHTPSLVGQPRRLNGSRTWTYFSAWFPYSRYEWIKVILEGNFLALAVLLNKCFQYLGAGRWHFDLLLSASTPAPLLQLCSVPFRCVYPQSSPDLAGYPIQVVAHTSLRCPPRQLHPWESDARLPICTLWPHGCQLFTWDMHCPILFNTCKFLGRLGQDRSWASKVTFRWYYRLHVLHTNRVDVDGTSMFPSATVFPLIRTPTIHLKLSNDVAQCRARADSAASSVLVDRITGYEGHVCTGTIAQSGDPSLQRLCTFPFSWMADIFHTSRLRDRSVNLATTVSGGKITPMGSCSLRILYAVPTPYHTEICCKTENVRSGKPTGVFIHPGREVLRTFRAVRSLCYTYQRSKRTGETWECLHPTAWMGAVPNHP